jgi:hypothetical protein
MPPDHPHDKAVPLSQCCLHTSSSGISYACILSGCIFYWAGAIHSDCSLCDIKHVRTPQSAV